MPIPSSDRLWVTLPTAEKFALEFEIFRLTLVPLGEGALTVTKQPQRLRSRVREMSCFRHSTLITSTLELGAFLRRFQEGGIKGSCCSDPRARTITKQSRGIPQCSYLVTVQLIFRGMERRCAELLSIEESLRKSIALCGCPYIALRDEEASRAGRYLEGTCALAIRPCNR